MYTPESVRALDRETWRLREASSGPRPSHWRYRAYNRGPGDAGYARSRRAAEYAELNRQLDQLDRELRRLDAALGSRQAARSRYAQRRYYGGQGQYAGRGTSSGLDEVTSMNRGNALGSSYNAMQGNLIGNTMSINNAMTVPAMPRF